MRGFEAQVNGPTNDARGEDGVAELEERVGTPIEAAVERVAEGAQIVESCGGVHEDGLCSPKSLRRPPSPSLLYPRS